MEKINASEREIEINLSLLLICPPEPIQAYMYFF